jgi:perosamine synthetase
LIPHSRPTLPTAEQWPDLMKELVPGWVADGPLVRQFEHELAPWLGAKSGVAVNSGSNALQIALLGVGVRPGTEVLVPAYCCAALLNAIAATGASAVLVDSEPGGHNLSFEHARGLVGANTSAVVVVHMFGDPADTARFRELGIPVVEDCAQSLGARRGGAYTGARGHAAIGSFFATKVITTGHGGIATSPNSECVARMRDLVEYDNREAWEPRFSYGFTELQAALGLQQVRALDGFLLRRRAIADYYTGRFVARHIGVPRHAEDVEPIFYRYVLRARSADEALAALRETGVDAKRPVYRPLHHYLGGDYPRAQAAHEQIVSLPIYPELSPAQMTRVADAVLALEDLWLKS